MGVIPIRIYGSSGPVTAGTSLHIDNNTFIDTAGRSSYGGAIELQNWNSGASVTNCSIQNNIFYDCGAAWDIIYISSGPPQTSWAFELQHRQCGRSRHKQPGMDSNGGSANRGTAICGIYALLFGERFAPDIMADTSAHSNGTNLYSWFTTDKAGKARPESGAWDIGAYEFSAGGPSTNPLLC